MSVRSQWRTWRHHWSSWREVEAFWAEKGIVWEGAERRRMRRKHALNRFKDLRHLVCCDTECG